MPEQSPVDQNTPIQKDPVIEKVDKMQEGLEALAASTARLTEGLTRLTTATPAQPEDGDDEFTPEQMAVIEKRAAAIAKKETDALTQKSEIKSQADRLDQEAMDTFPDLQKKGTLFHTEYMSTIAKATQEERTRPDFVLTTASRVAANLARAGKYTYSAEPVGAPGDFYGSHVRPKSKIPEISNEQMSVAKKIYPNLSDDDIKKTLSTSRK